MLNGILKLSQGSSILELFTFHTEGIGTQCEVLKTIRNRVNSAIREVGDVVGEFLNFFQGVLVGSVKTENRFSTRGTNGSSSTSWASDAE